MAPPENLCSQRSASGHSGALPRTLGLAGLWMLAVNGFIGAGIFGLPGGAARLAGDYSLIIYPLCALLMLPVILCFAEAASYFKQSGGPARYAEQAFGRFAGFQAGWLYYMARVISFAANTVLLTDSIGFFWSGATEGLWRSLLLILICALLVAINLLGTLGSMRSLALFTLAKFAVLLLIVVAGTLQYGPALSEFSLQWQGPQQQVDFGGATLLLIYAFVGFESAVVPAGESKKPGRHIPLALITGLIMVTVLYMLIQWVALMALPDLADSTSPLLDTAEVLMGTTGAGLLMAGVLASVGGNLMGAMYSTPRITFALSQQGMLPVWFAGISQRWQSPANSVLFFGLFTLLLALGGSFVWLAATTVLSRLLVFILTCLAIPRLRRSAEANQGFRLPGGYLFPILGIGACLWLGWQVSLNSVLMTSSFFVLGSVLYWWAAKQTGKHQP
ncbi:APC family permease [Lacimicrobium alkaliphilum]|uniref:Arginine/agmatine antiporter n=1 Tax=Lacimicrobium alkaliphilum TaxID=1526571 RepID=A0A0U3BBB4_9ALTE|nr:APC family permease [Lacimicrobium alkaliphilum]ALS98933.1 cationic amino acid transporter [Lacimicrobium alkaliphilum]